MKMHRYEIESKWKKAIKEGWDGSILERKTTIGGQPIPKEYNKNLKELQQCIENKLPKLFTNFYDKVCKTLDKTGFSNDWLIETMEETLAPQLNESLIHIALDLAPHLIEHSIVNIPQKELNIINNL